MKHRGTRTSKALVFGITVGVLGFLPSALSAQALWSPTDGRAKPVALLGADLSMTSHFDIREEVNDDSDSKEEHRGGGGCHSRCHETLNKDNHPRHRTALFESLARLKGLTEEFEEQFIWGGFTYAGAHYAQIVGRSLPDPGATQGSFQAVFGAESKALLSSSNINAFLNVETTNTIKNWKRCSVQNPVKQGTEFCDDGLRRTRNFETAEKILPPEIPASKRTFESNPCLMPDAAGQCQYDDDALLQLSKIGLPGLSLPKFPAASFASMSIPTSANCDRPDAPQDTLFPSSYLAEQLAGGGWPHWENLSSSAIPSEKQVLEGICEPLFAAAQNLKTALAECLTTPSTYLDMAFVDQPLSSWCDPAAIRQSICTSGPLKGSCLCRPAASREGCFFATGETPCGTKMSVRLGRPGRHQWAMCEISGENTSPQSMGYTMRRDERQFDNVLQQTGGRENITVLYTDGYLGGVTSGYRVVDSASADMRNSDTPIVVGSLMRPQAQQTLDSGFWANQTMTPTSNLFVFNHMRDRDVKGARTRSYTPGSHRLQEVLRDPTIDRGMPLAPGMNASNSWGIPAENKSSSAIDIDALRAAFRRSLNRAMAGSYRGAQPALDRDAELMVFHNFQVFGPKKIGMSAAHPGEEYVPHASRLSFYARGKAGAAPELICETDWQSKADTQLAPSTTGWAADALTRYTHAAYSNPSLGLVRSTPASTLDRDGDGASDSHPSLVLGRMAGGNSSQPVIVGAPVEIPTGADAKAFGEFMMNARSRPQVAYVMSNGFIHAFFAGRYQKKGKAFDYDLGHADLCKEMWRHRPSWVTEKEVLGANTQQARQLMDGPMVAHELRIGSGASASDYRTLLVAAQGKMGRGMLALDITDPVRPRVHRSWSLPAGFRATALPTVTEAVSGRRAELRPMVFMSGGYRGPAALYMHDMGTGEEATVSLPTSPGEDYPTAPVCFDRDGRGGATHCYLVSRRGRVVRVAIDPNTGSPGKDPTLASALERARARKDCLAAQEPGIELIEGEEVCGDEPAPSLGPVPNLGTSDVRFGEVRDMTPSAPFNPMDAGQAFYVSPVVYFDDQNQVNLIFGSGDIKEMQRPAGAPNFVYKLVEPVRASYRMRADRSCAPSASGSESGVITLPDGHMMVSPASVSGGVVSFTAYRPPSNVFERGTSMLYAMRYGSCADAVSTSKRPEARPIGEGLPGTPVLVGEDKVLLVGTTRRSGEAMNQLEDVRPVADGRLRVRRLYWRPLTSDRALAPQASLRPRRVPVEEPEPTPEPEGPTPEEDEPVNIGPGGQPRLR